MKTIIQLLFIMAAFSNANAQVDGDNLLEQLVSEEKHVGITAAVYTADSLSWKGTIGYADKENQIPFTEKTITRVASLAKPMTAIAIMQLVEAGKLKLDVSIKEYIPELADQFSSQITTRMLLGHTSGLAAYKSAKEAQNTIQYDSLLDVTKVFEKRALAFEPGTNFNYTTYGYVLLGVLIEKISGQSYEAYMNENIWHPAGMQNTSIEVCQESYSNKSLLYHKNRKKAKRADRNNLSNRVPAGGIQTTLLDVINFGQAVLDNKLISQATHDLMTTISFEIEEGNPFGLGWQLYGSKGNENGLIGHGGQQTGTNSQLFIVPKTKTIIAVLSNTSGTGNGVILTGVELYKKSKSAHQK